MKGDLNTKSGLSWQGTIIEMLCAHNSQLAWRPRVRLCPLCHVLSLGSPNTPEQLGTNLYLKRRGNFVGPGCVT